MENISMANVSYDTVTDVDFVTVLGSSEQLSTAESTTEHVYGIAYHHRLVVASCCCFITVLGVLGNSLVVIAVIVSKKLQTTTNILVINLTIADLVTCLILPFMVVGLIDRGDEYPLPEVICSIVTGVNFVCLAVSVITLAAIAFVRWYVISKSIRGHRGLHTPRKIGGIVAGIWMFSITAVSLPLSLGVGEVGYSRYYSLCSVTDTNPLRFYFVLLQAGLIFITLIITGIFYALIMIHVMRQTRGFRKKFAEDKADGRSKGTASKSKEDSRAMQSAFMKREFEITKNLFIVVCIFTLCLMPSIVNFMIPGTSVLTLYGAMILASNSSINPIIYALKHPNFQEAFKTVIRCQGVDNLNSSSTKSRSTASTNASGP